MHESRLVSIICMVIGVLVLFQISSCFRNNDSRPVKQSSSPNTAPIPAENFLVLANQRSDFLLWVGVPPSEPKEWAKVKNVNSNFVTAEGFGIFPVEDIEAYIVAYPNKQIVKSVSRGLEAPEGLTTIILSAGKDLEVLLVNDLEVGKRFVEVSYGPSETHPNEPSRYSTTWVNISNEKLRVTKFAGYWNSRTGWKLSTVTGEFFSAEEFIAWYGVSEDGWILPGCSVCDSNNYGSPPVLWAYHCETESGTQFIAGSVLR